MKKVGITGGIGAGKSFLGKMLVAEIFIIMIQPMEIYGF